MQQSGQPHGVNRSFSWRVGLCLFLAVLFFYNPFFTIYGSSAGLSARPRLSFRGTLASSELRTALIPPAVAKMEAPKEAALEVVQRPDAFLVGPESSHEEPLLSEKEATLGNLWFRPPPFSPPSA